MNSKEIVGSVFGFALKIVVVIILAMLVYKYAFMAYDIGYRVFGEEPMTTGDGMTISVAIPEGKSGKEIGEILEQKGLIRDAQVFAIQEKLSEYKDEIKPGIYELNTSMTAEEMIEVMAQKAEDETKEEPAVQEEPQTEITETVTVTGEE